MSEPRVRPLVLLVDDDPMMRLLGVEALEGSDFDVIEAKEGAQALALFVARTPDLVLLDVVMPGADGYAVCKQIRALPAGVGVPIMMMTGLDDEASIDRAYEVGATDFMTKPLNYGLLAHRLRYMTRAARAFHTARASSRRLGRAQTLARLAQWELDLDTQRFRWSDEASAIFGVTELEAAGGPGALLCMVHPDDRPRVAAALGHRAAHQIEYRILAKDGRERIVRQDAEVVRDEESGATLLTGAAQDVTELREAERKVRDLAYFDALTGLPNRALLRTFLDHALIEAVRDEHMIAILSLDIDGFKRVNDTLGHAAGDMVLREVAKRLSACIRVTDVVGRADGSAAGLERHLTAGSIASRLGGDEFVVVLTEVHRAADAALVARRIADRLAVAFAFEGTEMFISASIGVACFPDAGAGAELLLERADAAMYHAKQAGRNQCRFFTAEIQTDVKRRLDLENRLRASLARSGIHPRSSGTPAAGGTTDVVEFRVEYQPKVEVPSGRYVGVEALLRWRPRSGIAVGPAEFIPITEETGLIVPLGEWVLRTACAEAKRWPPDETGHLRVAVNVSARQFRAPDFVRTVASALAETGLAPELLELEITEGMLMQDTVASGKVLAELKAIGVRIALDDFGTGYSSLSYLARLPIDSLKIDRSFMADVSEAGRSAKVTSAIFGLARGLNIDVVVEGVETEDQLAFVRLHGGTTEIQGFLFAKPMTAALLEVWRTSRKQAQAAAA